MIVMFTALVGDKVRAHTRSKNNYLYFTPFVCAVLNKLTMNGLKRDDDGDMYRLVIAVTIITCLFSPRVCRRVDIKALTMTFLIKGPAFFALLG